MVVPRNNVNCVNERTTSRKKISRLLFKSGFRVFLRLERVLSQLKSSCQFYRSVAHFDRYENRRLSAYSSSPVINGRSNIGRPIDPASYSGVDTMGQSVDVYIRRRIQTSTAICMSACGLTFAFNGHVASYPRSTPARLCGRSIPREWTRPIITYQS